MTETGADFYKINPKGNVPALVLEDGTLLNEGAATLQWIADHAVEGSNLAPANGTTGRYVLQVRRRARERAQGVRAQEHAHARARRCGRARAEMRARTHTEMRASARACGDAGERACATWADLCRRVRLFARTRNALDST